MNLSDLKRERAMLCAVLDVPITAERVCCPFHEEKTPSCKIYCTNDVWFFKCFGGCGKAGTIIDAVKFKYNLQDFRSVISHLEKQLGIKIDRDVELSEIVLDMKRAEATLKIARETLANDFDVQETYMLSKRKLISLPILQKYGVGFLADFKFPEYWQWGSLNLWTFPITNEKGDLQWVKGHRENAPYDQPKAFSLPFGTFPKFIAGKQKPKHGTVSMFPAVELIPQAETIYLCPGELKALALLCLGFSSVSMTQGESGELPEFALRRIKKIYSKICLVYDNDKAGMEWRNKLTAQLSGAGFLVVSFTCAELQGQAPTFCEQPVLRSYRGIHVHDIRGKQASIDASIAAEERIRQKGAANVSQLAESTLIQVEVAGSNPAMAAPALPSDWRTTSPQEDNNAERAELLRYLRKRNVIVNDSDTIEILRQARDVADALARSESEITGVHQDWLDTYAKNKI